MSNQISLKNIISIFEKIWSLKKNNISIETIKLSLLNVHYISELQINEFIDFVVKTERCDQIITSLVNKYKVTKLDVIFFNKMKQYEDYVDIALACDMDIADINNFQSVFIDNYKEFLVININTIIEKPEILENFLNKQLDYNTAKPVECSKCGLIFNDNNIKTVLVNEDIKQNLVCSGCLEKQIK